MGIRLQAQIVPPQMIGQQRRNLAADCNRVTKRHEDSTPIGKQLSCVPVWSGDYRLSNTEAVRQRARCHLSFVEIRCYVNVAQRDEIDEGRLVDKLIEKQDVIRYAELHGARLQASSVGLPFLSYEIRVRRAEHDIQCVGTTPQNGGHGLEYRLDALDE